MKDLQRFIQRDGEKKREINERGRERESEGERDREREGYGALVCVLFSKLSTASLGAGPSVAKRRVIISPLLLLFLFLSSLDPLFQAEEGKESTVSPDACSGWLRPSSHSREKQCVRVWPCD